MTDREFPCELCGYTFHASNSEAERDLEYAQRFAEPVPPDYKVSLCDECYEEALRRLDLYGTVCLKEPSK